MERGRTHELTKGWFEFRHPKTTGSRRTIEIPAVTVDTLAGLKLKHAEQREDAGESWVDLDLVFTTRTGQPLDTTNILHSFQRLLKHAGFERMRFYDLRHTHASLLIAEGVHPKKIAERLGHASIKLTMDLYGRLFEGSDKESAERMQRLFGQTIEARSTAKPGKRIVVMPSLRKRS